VNKRPVREVLRQHWPSDRDVELVLRAESSPATVNTDGWADTLAATAVADFIVSMGPASAGAVLLSRGLQLQFGNAAILCPGLLSAATNASFVEEAAPIPVRQFSVDGPRLEPKKFATISTFTEEAFSHSTPVIEALVRTVLTESVGLALDAALFDASAGDATRPAGLRYNISGLAPSAATPPSEALAEDARELVRAVAGVAGNAPVVLIGSPEQAVSLRLWMGRDAPYEVLASSGLADGMVIAVASNALASAVDPAPRIDVSRTAVLHMEDAAPLHISSEGTPATVAAPVRSLFQTDAIGLRLQFQIDWALRNPGGLAWMSNVTW
jgi:Phage capsid family